MFSNYHVWLDPDRYPGDAPPSRQGTVMQILSTESIKIVRVFIS